MSLAMTNTLPAEPAATESRDVFSAVVPALKDVGNVGRKYVPAQVQSGGDYCGALFFGVGRGCSGEDQAVNCLTVQASKTVHAGGNRHGHAVFVEVGDGPLLRGIPTRGFSAEAVPGNIGTKGGDSNQSISTCRGDCCNPNSRNFGMSMSLGVAGGNNFVVCPIPGIKR